VPAERSCFALRLLQRVHCKRASTFQPLRLAGHRMKLEQRVAVAVGAMAEARWLDERAGRPYRRATLQHQLAQGRRARLGEAANDAGRAVAILHQRLVGLAEAGRIEDRLPVHGSALALGGNAEGLRTARLEARDEIGVEPVRAANDRVDIAGEAVAGTEVIDPPAVHVLRPEPGLGVGVPAVAHAVHLVEEDLRAALQKVDPAPLRRGFGSEVFDHVQHADQRAGRAPQRFERRVVQVALGEREERVGRGRVAKPLPLQQQHARVAIEVRRVLDAGRIVEAAAVFEEAGDRRIEIDREVGQAVLLQAL
jgi:hypothetical protein